MLVYFGPLSDVLVRTIQGSNPRFTIGVFGDWGTGKTTLMRLIQKQLQEKNDETKMVTVWFNAWRYEREEQFAVIPLLKTIAYAIPDNVGELKGLKQKIKRAGMNVLKGLPDVIPSLVKQYFGEVGEKVTEDAVNKFKAEFIPKFELLTEVDRETIYYDGLELISNELSKIRTKPGYRNV